MRIGVRVRIMALATGGLCVVVFLILAAFPPLKLVGAPGIPVSMGEDG